MRLPSPFRSVSAAMLAAWLAAFSACRDVAAPTGGDPTAGGVDVPARLAVVELAVGSSVLLDGSAFHDSFYSGFAASIISTNSGPATVALQQLGFGRVHVVGLSAGTAVIQGNSGLIRSQLPVKVLPVSSQPPTLVAVDFRVFEVPAGASRWAYVPQLVLRDSSGRGGSAVIAARFDVPGLAKPTASCAMVRPVWMLEAVPILHAFYGDYEVSVGSGDRAGVGEAVAHLTVRTPEGTAATLIVRGPIEQAEIPADYGGPPTSWMWMTCE